MHRNYFYITLAIALICLLLIFFSFWWPTESTQNKEPPLSPPKPAYQAYISGVGIVEPSSGNIFIGTSIKRVIEKVFVKVDDKIQKGDLLFQLEDHDLQANLEIEKIAYETALAQFQRLKAFPRSEDLQSAHAAVAGVKAEWELAKIQYEMVLRLPDPRAISKEERDKRLYSLQETEAKLKQAEADFELKKAGSWVPDLKIAHLNALQAKANVQRVLTEIDQTRIHSPIDGTVLQIKIHEGEFPPLDSSRTPLMILGNTEEIYLRVSINQLDIPKFQKDAHAVAFLQDNASIEYPLEFVRIEPYLVYKQNLTHEITEMVDTQVLQIIYKILKQKQALFIGQQMDVFIEVMSPL